MIAPDCEWTQVRSLGGVSLESCDIHRTEFRVNDEYIVMGDPKAVYAEWDKVVRIKLHDDPESVGGRPV